MYSKELLKGTLQTIVLRLLSERGKMYGYEITQTVKALSADKIQLTEGALYPSLHKLEKDGLLQTEKLRVNGRVRKYYQLTPTGKRAARDRTHEFADFVQTMRLLLNLQPDTNL
ncbi:MAG: PadR family transcriptional regulator [Bacteroidota bacterium]